MNPLNALQQFKHDLTHSTRKTVDKEDVWEAVKGIEQMLIRSENRSNNRKKELAKTYVEIEQLKRLNAALGIRLGYKHMSGESKKRIMGKK